MKKTKEHKKGASKTIIVRVTLTEGEYAEARQFYSHQEIAAAIGEAGVSELSELVRTHVEACQRTAQ